MSNFSERLIEERKRLGKSQEEFGAFAGVTKYSQLNYEKGVRKPDTDYLDSLMAAKVDVPFLLTGKRSFDPCSSNHLQVADSLPARLKQERKRLSLTIGQLAEKAGVDRVALMKWEDGEYWPDSLALQQLHAAGVDVAYVLLSLVGGSEGENSSTADEQELLKLYRAAPDEQTKAAARRVVGALVDSFCK